MVVSNLVGQTLGQYELREVLGIGGMGVVYRAYQASLRVERAVKVLPASLASEPGYAERFNREAETAAGLEHPHIVPILDYGSQQGITYVVMRLLTGGSLADRIRDRQNARDPLPSLGELSTLLKQLASALDYAHSQGVIHRDIKTSNVMFDNQGNSYLVDFGIAKLINTTSELTSHGMTWGTSAYMPPEQWSNQTLTGAADQYALGILAYAMVTGRMPFEAATPMQLMSKHLNEIPTPPQNFRADIPEAVTVVLRRALAKKAEERFPTVTAFAQAFESAIEGTQSEPNGFFTFKVAPRKVKIQTTQYPLTSQQQPAYKNPIFWGIGVLILLLTAILVVLLLPEREEPPDGTALALYFNETLTALAIGVTELTATDTASDAPTETPLITATDTATDAPTVTLIPSDTATDEPTVTLIPTATPSYTATSTDTPSQTPTATRTATPTSTPTATHTPTITNTPLPAGIIFMDDFENRTSSTFSLPGFLIRNIVGNRAYCGTASSNGVGDFIGSPMNDYSIEAQVLFLDRSSPWWVELRARADSEWTQGYALFAGSDGYNLSRVMANNDRNLGSMRQVILTNHWYVLRLDVNNQWC